VHVSAGPEPLTSIAPASIGEGAARRGAREQW
jgi:hypothetical protein